MKSLAAIAKHIQIHGIVQGVGFRPFVYRLAMRYGVTGHVCNRCGDVEIVVQGEWNAVDAFLRVLQTEAPPAARIESVVVLRVDPSDRENFVIGESTTGPCGTVPISPDIATCDECLKELFDPRDRRHRYAFINCAHCGPRYTIVRAAPYDRQRTSMAGFVMCAACRREFDNPADRRFHAQANACSECGPRVALTDAAGTLVATDGPIRAAAAHLRDGRIVAVKGLGGYHLAVDATNPAAVAELRRRKFREQKPFAVMAGDLDVVRSLCSLTIEEQRLLASPRRPIVLAPRSNQMRVAASVARGLQDLGVMLPYTPIHHLLLADVKELTGRPAYLVMTSGNRCDEPIAFGDEEAQRSLGEIADFFLVHDRPIENRCDDTVTRCLDGREMVVRRSRGNVPVSIATSVEFHEPVLACGAHLKNTVCIGIDRGVLLGPHVGDLDNFDTLQAFERSIETLQRLARIEPTVLAHDLHPDYLSTKYALDREGVTTIGVQHHHAHIASVIAEHGITGLVIGVAFDGTGYGTDGRIWGGEFLIADCADFVRVAHLEYVPLPGGEQAVRQPWRMAAVYLQRTFGKEFTELDLPFLKQLDLAKWRPLWQMIDHNLNCPLTSSMGRLFDAVAAIVLGRDTVSFEGQAAMELEAIADTRVTSGYNFAFLPGEPSIVDTAPVIRAIVNDLRASVTAPTVSGRFHGALANMIVSQCVALRELHQLDQVALSGGVFQNRLLTTMTLSRLRRAGFEAFTNNRVPANDGGISFGQAAVAAARLEK